MKSFSCSHLSYLNRDAGNLEKLSEALLSSFLSSEKALLLAHSQIKQKQKEENVCRPRPLIATIYALKATHAQNSAYM